MTFRILDPPQLLRCPCLYTVAITSVDQWPSAEQDGAKAPCPECGKAMYPRCGSFKKESRTTPADPVCHARWLGPGIRCRSHGGNYPKGVDHYEFTTGEESRYAPAAFPVGMAASDEELLRSNDPQIMVLNDLIDRAVARLCTGESSSAWTSLAALGKSIRRSLAAIKAAGAAGAAGDAAKRAEASAKAQEVLQLLETDLLPVILRGIETSSARLELSKLIELRSRVVSRSTQAEASVPVAVFEVFTAQLEAVMREHVSPEILPQVAAALRALEPAARNGRTVKLVGAGT